MGEAVGGMPSVSSVRGRSLSAAHLCGRLRPEAQGRRGQPRSDRAGSSDRSRSELPSPRAGRFLRRRPRSWKRALPVGAQPGSCPSNAQRCKHSCTYRRKLDNPPISPLRYANLLKDDCRPADGDKGRRCLSPSEGSNHGLAWKLSRSSAKQRGRRPEPDGVSRIGGRTAPRFIIAAAGGYGVSPGAGCANVRARCSNESSASKSALLGSKASLSRSTIEMKLLTRSASSWRPATLRSSEMAS